MFPEKKTVDAATLVAVGTRGTVGNLLMKEIEYYKRLESDIGYDSDEKRGGSRFWCGLGLFKLKWQKKMGNSGSNDKFLPKICVIVDAAECHHNRHQHRHENKIPGFNYHILEADTKQYKI